MAAEASEELRKLEDVFQFGFITQAEYQDRKLAILLAHNLPVDNTTPPVDGGPPVDDKPSDEQQHSDANSSADSVNFSASTHSFDINTHNFDSNTNNNSYTFTNYTFNNYNTSYSQDTYNGNTYNSDANYDADTYNNANNYRIDNSDATQDYLNIPNEPTHFTTDNSYHNYEDISSNTNTKQNTQYTDNTTEDISDANYTNPLPVPLTNTTKQDILNSGYSFKRLEVDGNAQYQLQQRSEPYRTDVYYRDFAKDGIVIYSRNLHGIFQTVPMAADSTLQDILKAFGLRFASLVKIDTETVPQEITPEFAASGEYFNKQLETISHLDQVIPAGHYSLVRNFTTIERGSWQARTDRAVHQFNYNQFANKEHIQKIYHGHVVPVYKKTIQQMCLRPCNFLPGAHKSYVDSLCAQASRKLETEKALARLSYKPRKLKFKADANPRYAVIEFFARLRALECKWRMPNRVHAIRTLKQARQERTCYFCTENAHQGGICCDLHSDKILDSLFTTRILSSEIWQQPALEPNEETLAERTREADSIAQANLLYLKHVKKADQHRYMDLTEEELQQRLKRLTKR